MVGVHQLKVIEEDGEKVLIVMLSRFQLEEVYPDVMGRLIETKYADKPEIVRKKVVQGEP